MKVNQYFTNNIKIFLIITFIIFIAIFSFYYFENVFENFENVFEKFEINNPINTNNIVIYYINLDHRKDRKQQFLDQMNKVGINQDKIIRIPAIYTKDQGNIGCSMSHVKAMEAFSKSNYENCIIFEDDFEFVHEANFIKKAFQQFFDSKINYDVCMLSSNDVYSEETQYPFLKKTTDTQTASGFMVSKQFAPKLLENFKTGLKLLQENYTGVASNYCVDQYWKLLQPTSNWYVFEPKLGKQQSGVSDIMGGFVEMSV